MKEREAEPFYYHRAGIIAVFTALVSTCVFAAEPPRYRDPLGSEGDFLEESRRQSLVSRDEGSRRVSDALGILQTFETSGEQQKETANRDNMATVSDGNTPPPLDSFEHAIALSRLETNFSLEAVDEAPDGSCVRRGNRSNPFTWLLSQGDFLLPGPRHNLSPQNAASTHSREASSFNRDGKQGESSDSDMITPGDQKPLETSPTHSAQTLGLFDGNDRQTSLGIQGVDSQGNRSDRSGIPPIKLLPHSRQSEHSSSDDEYASEYGRYGY